MYKPEQNLGLKNFEKQIKKIFLKIANYTLTNAQSFVYPILKTGKNC